MKKPMPKPPKPAPVVNLHCFPWHFEARSRTTRERTYEVDLSAKGFNGSCTCRYNRIAGLRCAHLKQAREVWWRECASRMEP